MSIIITQITILIQLSLVYHTSATSSYWDASSQYQWQYQTITCTPNQPCIVKCDDAYACQAATIICPEDNTCDITCDGGWACAQAQIRWPLIDGYGSLTCNSWHACESVNFPQKPALTSTNQLTVTCAESSICQDAEIYCPESASCYLDCGSSTGQSYNQCRGAKLYCAEGQDCDVYCHHGNSACWDLQMYCRTNDKCSISCWPASLSSSASCVDTELYSYATSFGQINSYCATDGCNNLQHFTWTDNPTRAPTPAPTSFPTPAPTFNPTPAPTNYPTPSPTLAPTSTPTATPTYSPTASPTTCYDINGTYTNDGYTVPMEKQIMDLSFDKVVNDQNKSIVTSELREYRDQIINLSNNYIQELNCSGFGSCVGSTIIARNNSICNIICDGYLSCLDAVITVEQCDEVAIICKGDKSCNTAEIDINSENNDRVSIKCGATSSCENLYINISGNSMVNITCYALNACDELTIDASNAITKNVYNYKHIHLEMLSYSESVMFFNGFGYEEEDKSDQYITCNTWSHYMQYPTRPSLHTSSVLRERAENEYDGNRLPCDGITVGCFRPNSSDVSSCEMQYTLSSQDFTIPSIGPSVSCYWVPVSEFVDISCAGSCASAPTQSPTPAPTNAPSMQTAGPTLNPTREPTIDPTIDPTADPTIDPTRDPTIEPTSDPTTAPSESPTISPTQSPTSQPTVSPTAAPTRDPTQDVDKIYDTKIDIAYYCYNLTSTNKEYIVFHTKLFVAKFLEIVERYYFDPDNGLSFADFWVQVITINGKNVVYTNQRRLSEGDSLELADIKFWDNSPVIITAKIECDNDNGEILITKSESSAFRSSVEQELSLNLFNNTQELYFKVTPIEGDKLYEEEKFPAPPAGETEDLSVLYVSVFIGISGVSLCIADFIFNKVSSKIDNSKYMAPLFVSLAIYDLMSDINLSIQMFKHENSQMVFDNFYFILALLSVVFIVLPLISNLWYAMWINSEETIANSPSARAWFGNHLPEFILLCMACGGTYPALGLTSSRLFGIEFFNAGLLTSDLHELSKIKLRSTVCLENAPQLLIQIIYSYAIRKWENATILAFVASSLSILASLAIYYAQRKANEKYTTTKYFLKLEANQAIDEESKAKIGLNKGRKEKLRDALCQVFNIPNGSIEIGYVTMNDKGCRIHVQHSIFKSEMIKKQKEIFKGNRSFTGYKIELTEEMYIDKVIKSKRKEILGVILNHFELENNQEQSYTISYQPGDEGYDEEILTTPSPKNEMRRTSNHVTTNNEEQECIEMVEIEDHSDEREFRFKGAVNEYQFQSLMKKVNEMKKEIGNELIELKTLIKSGEETNVNNNIERFVETQLSTSL